MKYEWNGYRTEPENWRQLLLWVLQKYEEATGEVFGLRAWQELVEQMFEPLEIYMDSPYRAELTEFLDEDQLRDYSVLYEQLLQLRRAYHRFLRAIERHDDGMRRNDARLGGQSVFISHRQCDEKLATRAACIVQEHGFDYWLDIEDPGLAAISSIEGLIPATVKSILIAATIEIGLLNSTHVLALLSKNAAGSQWIPYEYGRAKSCWPFQNRKLWSPNAATWVQSSVSPPEYAFLAHVVRTEQGIRSWLGTPRNPMNCETTTREDCLDH